MELSRSLTGLLALRAFWAADGGSRRVISIESEAGAAAGRTAKAKAVRVEKCILFAQGWSLELILRGKLVYELVDFDTNADKEERERHRYK